MGLGSYLADGVRRTFAARPATMTRAVSVGGGDLGRFLSGAIAQGGMGAVHATAIRDALNLASQSGGTVTREQGTGLYQSTGAVIGINDFGVKGRRQFVAERRRLLDLYVIALNNGDIRTAQMHLRNEIYRRGLFWEPAFEYRCEYEEHDRTQHARDYTASEAKKAQDGRCPIDGAPLRRPDPAQTEEAERFMESANYFDQSLEQILRECEDDINTIDDAFVYLRMRYTEQPGDDNPNAELLQLFRLDPTLIEHDMDARGVPGLAHHLCVYHRENLLMVPPDAGWDIEWGGTCSIDGSRTYPCYWKYSEQQSGAWGSSMPSTLYLLRDEVIHWSRYAPSETWGYPPVLSIYEKALTLIGMDRYLYDYFYERRVPQGAIAVSTDDVESFKASKADVEARMAQDPHYIPWIAISAKTGMGKMEFVRFAYSLDELNYLPVRDEIRERIAGLFGVSNIWMASTAGVGGLNSESQQLVVMSRVVEGAQRSYHTEVFPRIERALGVTDWHLRLRTPEEQNEASEVALFQQKATAASTMSGIGFGVQYDPDDDDPFTYTGSVESASEQQAAQAQQGGAPGAPGGGAPGGAGPRSGAAPPTPPPPPPPPPPPSPPSTRPPASTNGASRPPTAASGAIRRPQPPTAPGV